MHTGKLNLADFILNKNSSALLKTGSCFSARITVCSVVLGLCLSAKKLGKNFAQKTEAAGD